MFRPMRRFKQQISEKECIEVLTQEPRGVLSFVGDDGYPCGMPMDHWYNKEDGKLYFHGTKEGYKVDSLKNAIRFLTAYMIRATVRKEVGLFISEA